MAVRNVTPTVEELQSINPATGELMRTFPVDSDALLETKLQRASDAFKSWRSTSFEQRSRLMLRAADILEAKKHELGRTMTLEMGKPIRAAVQEADKCVRGCRFYAENAESFLADEPARSDATHSYVCYQPIGPVLAIMPWNFPFWQVFRFAAPALMAGNVGLLKHAANVPQCALAIEDVFHRAGFPAGVFQTLLIDIHPVERLLEDTRIAAATLTGSVRAGSSVASIAGRNIKKTVLELGGSDSFIVMPSANLEHTVATAVQARVINNGQSCIAAKRFIIHEAIYDDFVRRFTETMAALKVGDPLDESTDVGPLSSITALEALEDQVDQTVEMGARLLLGGRRLNRAGFYYPPTVLTDIPHASPAYKDELFGPVASLFCVRGIEEAVALANDSRFGLGASCWTDNQREREYFVREIESGLAFINGMVASDPSLPFGGVKQSGYGRELSVHGIREFVNAKTVSIYEIAAHRSETE